MSNYCSNFHSSRKILSVTAVKFYETYILAAIGGDLHIFGSSFDFKESGKIKVFDGSVIHRIVPNNYLPKLCVFGGLEVGIVAVNSTSSGFTVTDRWKTEDWVLSCQWVEPKGYLAIVSAHNVLSLRDLSTGTTLAVVRCVEKCILYSATILANSNGWKDTVVLAGTVFQQIVIWAVTDDSAIDRPVLHRLCGHKGVIFSVTYNERLRLICSTSDDRTVRVWSVMSPSIQPLSAASWRNASIILSVTIFGHTARVWQSYILTDRQILSIGEDSLLCVWDSTGESLSQRETHQGGGTWCVDVSADESLVVTGGADGGITLWPLHPPPTNITTLPAPPDIPRRVALLQGGRVIVVTERGKVMLFEDQWTCVFEDSRISSYCLLEVSPSKRFIGLATINGHIIVLLSKNFEVFQERQVSHSKVYSIHWLRENSILSCHDQGELVVWNISESGLEKAGRCYLPACKERWTTSAVMCGNTVVYGDRAGNIHSSPVQSHGDIVDKIHTLRRAHSRLGVCSLSVVRDQVWSTGRDGTLRQYTINKADHSLALVTASKLQMDWLAAVVVVTPLTTAVLCFHESAVVLWDLSYRRKLLSLQCGGGHRSWSCLVDDGNFVFTFLKDKTAHVLRSPLMPIANPVLMDGFHTREVNSVAHITDGWVVSGGEDGTVRLSQFSHSDWTTCAVEHNHLSSVRAVSVANINNQIFLLSAGGRAQMKVWRVSLNKPVCLTEIASVMLREERKGRHWLNIVPVSDPETRYMDLHLLPESKAGVDVLAACSDSYLRVFTFDLEKNEMSLVKTVKNSCYCMLRVSSFQCVHSKTVVVTTSTDGNVTFWDWPECKVISEDRVHQSGVNGVCVRTVGQEGGKTQVLVASGGDDNSVVVSVYHVTTSPQLDVERISRWNHSSLHSSVVTGVTIVGDKVVCCGGDQRVTLLSWGLAGTQLSVQVLAQYCCSVPDLKGLTMLSFVRGKMTLAVYGDGMEVLEIEGNS